MISGFVLKITFINTMFLLRLEKTSGGSSLLGIVVTFKIMSFKVTLFISAIVASSNCRNLNEF